MIEYNTDGERGAAVYGGISQLGKGSLRSVTWLGDGGLTDGV